jgi:uncharacterized membrane protein
VPTSKRNAIHWRLHLPYLVLLVAGTAFLLVLSLLQHRGLGTGYDLGIYDQVVWNLSHGRVWETTLVYETGGYYDHFEPILALLVPLYWLWSDVRILLIVQAVALGLGSLPIYLYAYVRFADLRLTYGRRGPAASAALLATGIAAVYLVFPALHHANLNDFHEVALMPPLLGFTLYGLLRGQRRVFFAFLVLCLMVKEDFGVTALALSAYIVVFKPRGFRRFEGVALAGIILVWVWLVLNVFYPGLTRGMPYPFVERRYAWLAETPQEALQVLLTRPWVIFPPLLQGAKLQFLLRLFAPLLFLPLLGLPVILLALPMLLYLMLSSYAPQWSVQSYYNPPLLPILFFALIQALCLIAQWSRRSAKRQRQVLAGLVAALLISVGVTYTLDAPGPGSLAYRPERFRITPRAAAAYELMAQTPRDASLSAIWPVIPHLSHRQRIYTVLARPEQPTDVIFADEQPLAQGSPLYPFAAPPGWPPVYHEYAPRASADTLQLKTLQRSVTLVPLAEPDPPSKPLSLAAYGWLDSPDVATPRTAHPGESLRLMLAWRRTDHLDRRYVFFVHMLDPVRKQTDGAPEIAAQSGHEAGDGRFPTTLWEAWTNPSIVLDEQRLDLPMDIAPGVYGLWAGAYDLETGQRVELGGPGQTLVHVGDATVSQP